MAGCLRVTVPPTKKAHFFTGDFALLVYDQKWVIALVIPDFDNRPGEHYDENQRAYWRF